MKYRTSRRSGFVGSAVVRELIGAGHEVVGLVRSVPVEAAGDHFGWLGAFATPDLRVSSAQTRDRYGWHPVHPELILDLEKGHYFTN